MADYPTLVIDPKSFVELPKDYGVIRTEAEMGYIQTRAKRTTGPRTYSFIHRNLDSSEVSTWVSFWDARKAGGESFNFTDPRTSTVVVCRFKQDKPRIRRTGAITWDIEVELEEAL